MAAIRTHLVKIGNSRGVRIPKALLEQLHLVDEVELSAQDDHLIIRPISHPRAGWEEAFAAMVEHGDDLVLDAAFLESSEWDETEWQW